MSSIDVKLHKLRPFRPKPEGLTPVYSDVEPGYWHARIWAEIHFAAEMSKAMAGKWDKLIEEALDDCLAAYEREGCLPPETGSAAEAKLAPLSAAAKEYTVICAAHAHIDMNWQWSFDETVAVVIDTFRTMLELIHDYDEFVFSQSQAAVYKIIADYAPASMLEEIKHRVAEGRWCVTASTWVELDKNMPSGESMARHALYTKNYLAKLLALPKERLNIDFEPDTFGHSRNVPEVLRAAGVKYHYHCRGLDGPLVYRFRAPSGAEVLSYRDPRFYNNIVNENILDGLMDICAATGQKDMLYVYGVGDHGGGPTRRDIERILDMRTWPVMPKFKFGTYEDFFQTLEPIYDMLPVIDRELNPIFTGCYSSQSRIKRVNRVGEAVLCEAEAFSVFVAQAVGMDYPTVKFEHAWEDLLFSQFHDILTGSSVIQTREYALGKFQETMAAANTQRTLAMRDIAARIDTSHFAHSEPKDSVTEGAGVGYGISEFRVMSSDSSSGLPHVITLFNPAPFPRTELVPLTVWDWKQNDVNLMVFKDETGNVVPHQVLDNGFHWYWFHSYVNVILKATVPATGWTTLLLDKSAEQLYMSPQPVDQLVYMPETYVLENKFIKVIFDAVGGRISSFTDKQTGRELAGRGGVFRLVQEDPAQGMAAWRVGRYMSVVDLAETARLQWTSPPGATLRSSISLTATFGRSKLTAIFSLDDCGPALTCDVECDWQEAGTADSSIPQLQFWMPLEHDTNQYIYDVPFGILNRAQADTDLPGQSFIYAPNDGDAPGLMLWSDSTYGFRGNSNAVSVTLIRSSYDPDPYPEYGIHKFQIKLAPVPDKGNALSDAAFAFAHPISAIFGKAQAGPLPMTGSFLEIISGSCVLSGVKMAEDGDGMIIRLYETLGKESKTVIRFRSEPRSAAFTDLIEQNTNGELEISEHDVSFTACPYAIHTIRIS